MVHMGRHRTYNPYHYEVLPKWKEEWEALNEDGLGSDSDSDSEVDNT